MGVGCQSPTPPITSRGLCGLVEGIAPPPPLWYPVVDDMVGLLGLWFSPPPCRHSWPSPPPCLCSTLWRVEGIAPPPAPPVVPCGHGRPSPPSPLPHPPPPFRGMEMTSLDGLYVRLCGHRPRPPARKTLPDAMGGGPRTHNPHPYIYIYIY